MENRAGTDAFGRPNRVISFVPERGRLLLCNFDEGRVHPEMSKVRRVIVVSFRSYNHRHGMGPGRCVVVPLTATGPRRTSPADVFFRAGCYEALNESDTWANCAAVTSVSHSRLSQVRVDRGVYVNEKVRDDDMSRIEAGLRHALGFSARE